MKKLSLIILVFITIFSSCKKVVNSEDNSISAFNPIQQKVPDGIVDKLFVHFPNFGDVWCGAQPLNCFREVVIVGYTNEINRDTTQYNLYEQFVNDFNEENVISFFENENWSYLFPNLPHEVVEQIISKNYSVFYNPTTEGEADYMLIIAPIGVSFEELSPENIIYGTPVQLD